MFLKVSQSYHVVVTLASLRPSQMEAKARMVWVNGHGCQRAYSYRKARQTRCSLCSFVSVLTSRIAGYVIRMSGGVGGALSDGRPYPDSGRLSDELSTNKGHFQIG